MVIRTDDGRIVLNPSGEIEVREVPAGLISKPTLFWDVEAAKGGENAIEISYLTKGMSWAADYVLTLSETSKADLQGWVTLNNASGATFQNAKLKLLAGDVQRVQERFHREMVDAPAAAGRAGGAQFQEESLFEYHLYTLQRPTDLRDREIKQVSLLEGKDVPVSKKLVVDALRGFGRFFPNEGEIGLGDIKPQVRLEFTNDKESHLGMPLPKGRVKVYQRDKSGSVQLLGEDEIGHTPRNEKLSLVVGRSFDVVASRRRTSFRRINDRTVQEAFEIEVRNRKETPETVHVLERHYGDWRVTSKSMEFTKPDASTMQFVLVLKPNEARTISYTVETRW
jgi:hypothetical protein